MATDLGTSRGCSCKPDSPQPRPKSSRVDIIKNSPFVVCRYDTDISILPRKHLVELRNIPAAKLSAIKVQISNLVHNWTYSSFLEHSDLHFRVIERKLAPELPKYLLLAKEEMHCIWDTIMPQNEDWATVDIQRVIRRLVAGISSRLFLGSPICRDPRWLDLALEFPSDVNQTAFALRALPSWLHPLIARLLPSRRRMKKKLDLAAQILAPTMDSMSRQGETDGQSENETLLQWMMDHGNTQETRLHEMATRSCLLMLASIHSTTMAVTHVLFDLCSHPEWFEELRDEIRDTSHKLGPMDANDIVPRWLSSLEKMDSLLVESQRLHPPIILSPQREALAPITLHDGTHIPQGCRVAFAASCYPDASHSTSDAERFDPMRSYRKRHAAAHQRNRHLAGQISPDNLVFGYGRFACPGRAFAVTEVKMILVDLLSSCEFKLPDGVQGLECRSADEIVYPIPEARIVMRRREKLLSHI
ncbi:cytochrome P450 [Xylariaceae sp. FL0016]|nr:cytochrome P450 [Xylariaceae sp. FL0016]